ncbi:MAG: hypothetical protein FJY67_10240 [Calditrichaeota bacterium]|nr:hypothetical protein [Calditrichota bacterium]
MAAASGWRRGFKRRRRRESNRGGRIEGYLQKAIAAGASVAVPKTEIPGHGWFAHLLAPDVNTVGLFQSGHQQQI